jgi:hypothetical protein
LLEIGRALLHCAVQGLRYRSFQPTDLTPSAGGTIGFTTRTIVDEARRGA